MRKPRPSDIEETTAIASQTTLFRWKAAAGLATTISPPGASPPAGGGGAAAASASRASSTALGRLNTTPCPNLSFKWLIAMRSRTWSCSFLGLVAASMQACNAASVCTFWNSWRGCAWYTAATFSWVRAHLMKPAGITGSNTSLRSAGCLIARKAKQRASQFCNCRRCWAKRKRALVEPTSSGLPLDLLRAWICACTPSIDCSHVIAIHMDSNSKRKDGSISPPPARHLIFSPNSKPLSG